MARKRGWFGEPGRHALAARGIKTASPRVRARKGLASDYEMQTRRKFEKWLGNEIRKKVKDVAKLENQLDVVTYFDSFGDELDIEVLFADGTVLKKTLRYPSQDYPRLNTEDVAKKLGTRREVIQKILQSKRYAEDIRDLQQLKALENVLLDLMRA